jgi:hypothetical protein
MHPLKEILDNYVRCSKGVFFTDSVSEIYGQSLLNLEDLVGQVYL